MLGSTLNNTSQILSYEINSVGCLACYKNTSWKQFQFCSFHSESYMINFKGHTLICKFLFMYAKFKFKKLDSDFEKVRQSHLLIQREFINKMQSIQFNEFEEYGK